MKHHSGGNSLIEYVLPLVIFFLAGGFLAVILDVPDRLASYLADTLNGSRDGAQVQVQALGSAVEGGTLSSSSMPGQRPGLNPLSLSSGEILSFTEIPTTADLQQMLETAGANGTTRILSSRLEKTIDELQASGELDETQASLLKELSNQGHRIAQLEQYLEEAAETSGTSEEYNSKMYLWDGQYLTTKQLQNKIGWGDGMHPKDVTDPLSAINTFPETNKLLKLYQQANEQGAMRSPGVKSVVSELVSEIAFLTEVAEKGAHISATQDPALFRDSMVSEVTHYDSAGICQAGTRHDSGKRCH